MRFFSPENVNMSSETRLDRRYCYTRKANFSQESGRVMEVDMMLLEGRLSTGLVEGVRVVQLDYNTCLECDHSDMAMFIFVPEVGVSLEEAEEVVMKAKVRESLDGRWFCVGL